MPGYGAAWSIYRKEELMLNNFLECFFFFFYHLCIFASYHSPHTLICNVMRAKGANIQLILGVFLSFSESTVLLPSSLKEWWCRLHKLIAETHLGKASFPPLAIVLFCFATKTPTVHETRALPAVSWFQPSAWPQTSGPGARSSLLDLTCPQITLQLRTATPYRPSHV